jgi:hypothetical protein
MTQSLPGSVSIAGKELCSLSNFPYVSTSCTVDCCIGAECNLCFPSRAYGVDQGKVSQIDRIRFASGHIDNMEDESCDSIVLSVLSVSPITPFLVYKW